MNIVTISKKNIRKNDIVAIPRKEYERLLKLKQIKEFIPTTTQKKALARAESNFRRGKTLSYNELTQKLGFTH